MGGGVVDSQGVRGWRADGYYSGSKLAANSNIVVVDKAAFSPSLEVTFVRLYTGAGCMGYSPCAY